MAAANKGRSVILVEPTNHLGGLTSGGLGQTDTGVEGEGAAIGGMSSDFYRKIRRYYENDDAWTHQTRDEYMDRTIRLQSESDATFACLPGRRAEPRLDV